MLDDAAADAGAPDTVTLADTERDTAVMVKEALGDRDAVAVRVIDTEALTETVASRLAPNETVADELAARDALPERLAEVKGDDTRDAVTDAVGVRLSPNVGGRVSDALCDAILDVESVPLVETERVLLKDLEDDFVLEGDAESVRESETLGENVYTFVVETVGERVSDAETLADREGVAKLDMDRVPLLVSDRVAERVVDRVSLLVSDRVAERVVEGGLVMDVDRVADGDNDTVLLCDCVWAITIHRPINSPLRVISFVTILDSEYLISTFTGLSHASLC